MNYTFVVYSKETLEKVGEVVTNHYISLDDAIDLLDATRLEVINSDDPDFKINGKEYWLDDLDIALEDDYNLKVKFDALLDKCVTKNGSGRECFSLAMLDDEDIKWMADNCQSWDWLDVTDDGGNNLLEIAQEKGYVQD